MSLSFLSLQKSRFWLVASLAAVGVISGFVPEFTATNASFNFRNSAIAQGNVTDAEVKSYARAVLSMETRRQQAYREIKAILGNSEVPTIACDQPMNNLPKDVRVIAQNYCDSSKQIVIDNGLSINRFNSITSLANSNPNVERRIQAEMIRIQQQ